MPRTLRATFLIVLSFAPPSRAQDPAQETVRRALIVDAEAASDRGDHARALDLATRAAALRETPSLGLLVAQEHDALGNTLDALDRAERCAREAELAPGLNRRDAILAGCRGLADRLRAQVATLTVDAPEGVDLRVGGAPLASALRGLATPRMPGETVVEAGDARGIYFTRALTLRAGSADRVEVPPPPPLPRPSAIAPSAVTVAPVAPLAPVAAPPRSRPSGAPGVGPWVLGGVGLAAVAAGALLWWRRDASVGDCAVAQDALECPSAEAAARAEPAAALGISAQVVGVAGGVALASSVVWLLVDRATRPRDRAVAPCAVGAGLGVCGAL